jgi:hypothetical protein
VRYVARRLARYLPITWLNRLAQRRPRLGQVYERVIPLNPRDSFALLLRRHAYTYADPERAALANEPEPADPPPAHPAGFETPVEPNPGYGDSPETRR